MNINLLEMSFTGAVLIAAVLILRALLLNRLPKRTFPALWGVAILRLLLPFSVASALSVYSLFPLPLEQLPLEQLPLEQPSEPPVSAPVTQTAPRIPEAVVTETAPAPHPFPQKTETTYFAENAPTVPTKPAELPAAAEPVSAETVWFFVWCSGAVLSLSGFAAVYLRERRKFRASIPEEGGYTADWLTAHPIRRRVTVRRSDRIDAPLTYGLFRPVILLPDSMDRTDEKRLDYVLTHEMVHICRFDAVKKPICALALCVHWFNPLVWVMFFLFSRDLELACDEGVVRRLGEDQKSDYAKTLIGMEAERSGFLPLFSRFGGFAAEERIRAIMKIKKSSAIAGAAACLLVCATAGVFATSAAQTEEEDTTVISEETLTDVMFDDGRTVSPVEWWTAEEYEQWIIEQEKEMESLIGTGSGWYDREGVFHEFTREAADSTIAEYREILEQIKQGLLLSKDNGDHVVFSTIPPSEQSAASEAESENSKRIPEDRLAEWDFGKLVAETTSPEWNTHAEQMNRFLDGLGDEELKTAYQKAFALFMISYRSCDDLINRALLTEYYGKDFYTDAPKAKMADGRSMHPSGYLYEGYENAFLDTFTSDRVDAFLARFGNIAARDGKELVYEEATNTRHCSPEYEVLSRTEDEIVIRETCYEVDSENNRLDAILYINDNRFVKEDGAWKCADFDTKRSAASEADGYAALERAIRPYMPFGVGVRYGADGEPEIVYYEEDGVMRGADGEPKTVYRGKTVRSLYDAASGEKITAHAGEWDYGADAVDLYAVYEYGVLTRVCEADGESLLLYDDGIIKKYMGNVPNPEWTQTFAESGGAVVAIDEAALFAEYEAYGLTRRESDGALFYKGTRVRWFIDGVDLDGEGAFATRYTYHNENGMIDLHTVWEKKKNGDGSYDPFGTLVAIEEYADFVPSLVIAEHEAVTAIALEEEKNAELPETPDESPKRSPKLKYRQDKDLLEALAEQASAPLDQEYMSDPFVSSTNLTFEKLPYGTEIHSVADGTVVFSEFAFNGSGLTVVVRSEDGTCWGYGHCDPDLYTASLGDMVKAGDVIAHAGTTGWTAGTALCLFLVEDDGSVFASAAPESVQMTTAEGSGGGGGRTFSEIFAEYEWFGITYNEAEGNVYFNGKLVGTFFDQTGSGVFSYQSRNVGNRATIDVRTRRYPSGKLTSVEEMTEEEKNAGFLEAPADDLLGYEEMKKLTPTERIAYYRNTLSAGNWGFRLYLYPDELGLDLGLPLDEKYLPNGWATNTTFYAEENCNVYSVADGTVVYANEYGIYGSYGKTVVIEHENGYASFYAHLKEINVKTGQKVKKGDVIGTLADWHTAPPCIPRLSFELYKDREPLSCPDEYTLGLSAIYDYLELIKNGDTTYGSLNDYINQFA